MYCVKIRQYFPWIPEIPANSTSENGEQVLVRAEYTSHIHSGTMLIGRLPSNIPCLSGCTEVGPHVCLHDPESKLRVSFIHPTQAPTLHPTQHVSTAKQSLQPYPTIPFSVPSTYHVQTIKPSAPLAGPLTHLIKRFSIRCQAKNGFLGQTSLSPYLFLLLQRTRVSNASVALALWYVHRLCDLTKATPIEEATCGHCLTTTCLMLAEKFLQDGDLPTRRWADAAGWTLKDANRMERHALKALKYDLFLSAETFQEFLQLYKHDPHRLLWESQQGQTAQLPSSCHQ